MLGDELNKDAFELADLDKGRCALLVIDVLGDPTALPSPLRERMVPVVENAARLCDAARAAGVPVVFSNDAHLPGLERELALWGEHGLAGTPAAQVRRRRLRGVQAPLQRLLPDGAAPAA